MDDNQEETSQLNNESENQNPAPLGESSSTPRATSTDEPRSQASRIRRLVSQSTLQENDLDNAVLNSQQQFIDIETDSDDTEENEDPEQLFEEYIRENAEAARSQGRLFDDELPMNHSYLGSNMDIVRGTNYFEPGRVYEIPVCGHHSMVFPGEIFPMITIAESIFARTPESNEGLAFGLVFTHENENDKVYGVTCQVFEKGLDIYGHITVKSRAHQRFEVIDSDALATSRNNQNLYSKVKILPEFELPDPISLNISNNLLKFTQNPSQSHRLKALLCSSSRWPKFVYDQYSIISVNEKIERYLAMLNLVAPTDLVQKSFWLARNIPLNQGDRLKIFTTNCVNKRMMLMSESLNFMCFFDCKRCATQIASYSDIFAMAKGNVNANYCNPAGYIHETLTVHKTSEDAVRIVDRPSTEFSWFPGYAWQIAVCIKCQSHIGWKFIAVTKNLKPKAFFGLSCKSLVVSPEGKTQTKGTEMDSDETTSDEN